MSQFEDDHFGANEDEVIESLQEDIKLLEHERRLLKRQRDQFAEVLKDHVHLCPLGWHQGRLMKSRMTTDAQVIEWLMQLRRLVGVDPAGGVILPDSPSSAGEKP